MKGNEEMCIRDRYSFVSVPVSEVFIQTGSRKVV